MAQVIQRFGGSMEGRIDEHPENGSAGCSPPELTTQQQLEALQVGDSSFLACFRFASVTNWLSLIFNAFSFTQWH